MEFTWRPNRDVAIDGAPDDAVLTSFLWGDVGRTPSSVEYVMRTIEEQRDDPDDDEWMTGNGYSLRVRDGDVLIRSNFDQFPETTYPVERVLGALREFRDWLRDNPRPPVDTASGG